MAHGGTGVVYLFHRNVSGGCSETKLVASDGVDGDRFGKSVALSVAVLDDAIVVGAPGDAVSPV